MKLQENEGCERIENPFNFPSLRSTNSLLGVDHDRWKKKTTIYYRQRLGVVCMKTTRIHKHQISGSVAKKIQNKTKFKQKKQENNCNKHENRMSTCTRHNKPLGKERS